MRGRERERNLLEKEVKIKVIVKTKIMSFWRLKMT